MSDLFGDAPWRADLANSLQLFVQKISNHKIELYINNSGRNKFGAELYFGK